MRVWWRTALRQAVGALAVAVAPMAVAEATAQATSRAGGSALEVSYAIKLPRGYRLAFGPALELRPYTSPAEPSALRNADLNVAVVRRWLRLWRFGSALRLRRRYALSEDPARELRTWLYAERRDVARYTPWALRLRTEQRWRGDVGEALRLSYRHRLRIGAEWALRGLTVDEGEWYAAATAELLVSTRGPLGEASSVDWRPYVGLGSGRAEYGLEVRTERALGTEGTGDRAVAALLVVQLSL